MELYSRVVSELTLVPGSGYGLRRWIAPSGSVNPVVFTLGDPEFRGETSSPPIIRGLHTAW